MLADYESDYEAMQTTEHPKVQISQGLFALLVGLLIKI